MTNPEYVKLRSLYPFKVTSSDGLTDYGIVLAEDEEMARRFIAKTLSRSEKVQETLLKKIGATRATELDLQPKTPMEVKK